MPKFADCPWPMHSYLSATQLTLHMDVTPAHGLRKKDAGIFPRAVICVHPVGGRMVEVKEPTTMVAPSRHRLCTVHRALASHITQQGHVEP